MPNLATIQRYAASHLERINTPPDKIAHQFLRYVLVLGLAYLVDILVLVSLTEMAGIHYLKSAAIAYIAGLLVKYILSIFWVFNTRRVSNKYVEFSVFIIIGLAGLAFNELFIWMFTGLLGFHYLIGKVVSAGFTSLWNFGARKYVLFR